MTSTYSLTINLLDGISTFVEKGKYAPVVEILPHTAALVLPPEEGNKWVEINGRSGDFPVLKDSNGDVPSIVQPHDDVPSHFDLKFDAPKSEQQNLWFAVKTDPVEGGEVAGDDGLKIDVPVHFDLGLVGTTIGINKFGRLKASVAGDNLQASLPALADHVGLVLDTKTTLLFWIQDSSVKTPPDIDHPEQEIEMLPGLARIQLPSQAGAGLQVKVWLEAQDNTGLVKYQDQSHKILVRYIDETDLQQLHLNALGLWDEDKPLQNGEPVGNAALAEKTKTLSQRLGEAATN
ncbi:hypothetical protein PV04_07562 [Phialophora macrospora]|uniref:Uncharacterized protein n=1 Tax=Phialophora macrospora TaxID=1851006 RepID=A0A0D2CJ69_9EURO|nr:hypothetical protein PV04_07562 [Phialophora macrospora]